MARQKSVGENIEVHVGEGHSSHALEHHVRHIEAQLERLIHDTQGEHIDAFLKQAAADRKQMINLLTEIRDRLPGCYPKTTAGSIKVT